MFVEQGPQFMKRCSHRDVKRLEFLGTRNQAAVIVRHDPHRFPGERKVEDPFAGNVEIVAVDEADHDLRSALTMLYKSPARISTISKAATIPPVNPLEMGIATRTVAKCDNQTYLGKRQR